MPGRWPAPTAVSSTSAMTMATSLKFKAKPDYEMPTDTDKDNVYEVTVRPPMPDGKMTGNDG